MLIDNYEFEGPFVSKQMIRAEPGVYVILDGLSLSRPKVIYVGQSMSLRTGSLTMSKNLIGDNMRHWDFIMLSIIRMG